jgi:hypothetical protein
MTTEPRKPTEPGEGNPRCRTLSNAGRGAVRPIVGRAGAVAVGLLMLLTPACERGDGASLRDSLAGLPRDTAAAAVAEEEDTVARESESVQFAFPAGDPVPTDGTREAREHGETAQQVGQWTAGVVSVRREQTGVAGLASVRSARHADFDRVVIEFSGDDLPDYHVEYVDRPIRQCGSGHVVEVPGDGWLAIRLEPARAHDDEGRATLENRLVRPDLPNVVEIRLICDFEAHVDWVLGVRSPNPFRVLELHEPMRLVIDVRR